MNNKTKYILLTIITVLLVTGTSFGVFVILGKKNNNINKDNNTNPEITINDSTDTTDGTDIIKNEEIKKLYNYVKASLNSNNVCLGYYYQNPFSNHTEEDKVSLVLMNYASQFKKSIDDEFLQKISEDDRELVKNSSVYYLEPSVVKEGLRLIYNIDIDQFNTEDNYMWKYREDVNAFVDIGGGGAYPADIIQKVIGYGESEEDISVTEVKAEILEYSINYGDEQTPAGVYRYVNNKNTLTIEGNTDNFEFTHDNLNKFPQLKYIFKKNENGHYYLSDIVNLNWKDYEECSKQSN